MTIERVAVIGGTGDEGFGLALRWAGAGIPVTIGSRRQEKADDAVRRLEELLPDANVDGMENAAATASSDIVVVTIPFSGQGAIYRSIADSIREGAVVIDCTVPVEAAVGGKPTRVLGVWEGSAAQLAQSLLPKGTQTCAAFHSLAAAALNELGSALEGDVLVCGPKAAKPVAKELVEAIPGLRFVDAGPLENARIVEPITSLLIGINRRYRTDRAGIRITGI
ncbi:MAG: NADPH-dependent F420 reductase [Actinobacteria bacterium]|nr:NADPH-dependent F420 reductase [Actinomycetota bacterium]